ncbi:InlB B-repeat-containing protein [Blautia schinkii]|nr:InlB B-repeat-containing protein [Blautia schinkii]
MHKNAERKNVKKRLGISLLCAVLTLTQLPAAVMAEEMAAEENFVNEEAAEFTDGAEEVNGNIIPQEEGFFESEVSLSQGDGVGESEDEMKQEEEETEIFSDALTASEYGIPKDGEVEFGDGEDQNQDQQQDILFRNGIQTELDISKGNIVIGENSVSGTDTNGVIITSPNSNGYKITGNTSQYTVKITGGEHHITLNGVNIQVNDCAFQMNGATVNLTLAETSKNTLDSSSGLNAALQVNTGSTLILVGNGELIAKGGMNGAGIGGGANGSGGLITIGGNVSVTATGGTNSAGIGGGANGSGGSITIEGNASVKASSSGKAGIGGGSNGESGNIVIQGNAFVEATGGQSGAAIGSGSNKGVQSITFNGNVLVMTYSQTGRFIGKGSIAGAAGTISKVQGVIFEGNKGTVYGTAPVSEPFTIPADGTLTVPEDAVLTIPDGVSHTNNGVIENKGQITGSGSIVNNGTINDYSNQVSVSITGTGKVIKSADVRVSVYDSNNNPVSDVGYGETICIKANVSDASGNDLDDGSMTFKSGASLLKTVNVSNGQADSGEITLTGAVWKPGSYTIQAEFSGADGTALKSTANLNLTVKKASRTISLAGTSVIKGSNVVLPGAALSAGAGDGAIQYGYSNVNDIAQVTNWQDSRSFNNLEIGKKYYFFARVSEGVYYEKTKSGSMEVEISSMEGVWVNNVNLLTASDNTTQCGSGTASYNVNTRTLTLTNATVERRNDNHSHSNSFIWLDVEKDCTIVLNGQNTVGITDDESRVGIQSESNLTITGDGSLTVKGGGNNQEKTFTGITANQKNIAIKNTEISFENENVRGQNSNIYFTAINVNTNSSLTVSDSTINVMNYTFGIGGGLPSVKIKGSEMNYKVDDHTLKPYYGINGTDIRIENSKMVFELAGGEEYFKAINSTGKLKFDGADIKALLKGNEEGNCIMSDDEMSIQNGTIINVESGYPSVYSSKDIIIAASQINAVTRKGNAIWAEGKLTVSSTSDIETKTYLCGLESGGDMRICDSRIDAVSSNANAIFVGGNLEISGASNINTEGYWCGIQSLGNVTITGGRIEASSSHDSAIFAEGSVEISGMPDIRAYGFYPGLDSMKDMTISGGKIESVSSTDIGIRTRGILSIAGGEIYAKGKPGYAGIAALNLQTASEEAVLRIDADIMAEKNNAWPDFSDWTYYADRDETRSWNAFIPQSAGELEVLDGRMLNALTEVWLKPACKITFDVNGGSGANTTVKVYPGNTVEPPAADPTRPGYYFSGWLAEDGSDFDFASTPVNQDMTLKAKWSAYVYDYYYSIQASAGEHGTITPSGNISVREYTDQTFAFTPDEGYETAVVLVDGQKVEIAEKADSYKFERVTSGHTIDVSFLKIVPETYPDGTIAKPDGSFETPEGVVTLPDGTVILNDKDKTELKPDSEGKAAIVNKNGTVTVQDGSVRNPDGTYARPARPVIERVEIKKNRADIYLEQETAGATGYDYVISPNPNCIVDKDYTQVNKNVLLTNTSMFYVQQDTYYAYCHSWLRDSNGRKVFSQWSEGYEFTVPGYTPDTPSIVKVANPKKGVVVVTVSVPEGAKGFDVILGRSVKKVNGEKRPVDYGKDVRKNQRSTLKTVTFKNVKPGRIYAALHSYSRTPETNAKVFSRWSGYKTIKVK